VASASKMSAKDYANIATSLADVTNSLTLNAEDDTVATVEIDEVAVSLIGYTLISIYLCLLSSIRSRNV